MRTTINLDDDIFQAAQSLARSQSTSIGKVISELARKGMQHERGRTMKSGLPVFTMSPDAAPITPEMVKDLENEW